MYQERVLPGLDARTHERWLELSRRTQGAALGLSPCSVNDELESEANREPEAPTAPAFCLWMADNFTREARYSESLPAFDIAIDRCDGMPALVEGVDLVQAALRHKAQAASHAGLHDVSVRTFRELAGRIAQPEFALFEAGRALEMAGRLSEAGEQYSAASSASQNGSGHEPAQRALARLTDARGRFFPGVAKLADHVRAAVRDRDSRALRALISSTHFSTGVAGGHAQFDNGEVLDWFCAELSQGNVEVGNTLLGSGNKRYLFSNGWDGEWFTGSVGFTLTRSGRGWQWTGILVTAVTDAWREHWGPYEPRTNQPLTLEIKAPWPAGQRFMAGGLGDFAIKSAAVALGGLLLGPGIAYAFSLKSCGYGPRGFYYNDPFSHNGNDAFAIDFTRYRRGAGILWDNESGGTPVLAVADGIVTTASSGMSSGDESESNTVEIIHDDPDTGQPRYLTRYMHMAGPFQLSVSSAMAVGVGMRLGLMNDTGTSRLDHLHFSIHDQNAPLNGASVRPSPMDGQTLGDGNSGKCILSSNRESVPVGAVVGKITMLRAHELDTGFGPPDAFHDCEVIVRFDTDPDVVYGLQLRQGETLTANRGMFAQLRHAFSGNFTVRINFVRVLAADLRIIRVELEDTPSKPPKTIGDGPWPNLENLEI